MDHEKTATHADGTVRETPSQGIFLGYTGLALLALMAVFTLAILIAAVTHG